MDRRESVSIVAAVNNDAIFESNLAASPLVKSGVELHIMRGYSSAGHAYNAGISKSTSEFVVFAHQDVYLPGLWLEQLYAGISKVRDIDPCWGVIGIYGVQMSGGHVGRCWSSSIARELGYPFSNVHNVCSIDELVIVVRANSQLRFDEQLPGYHLYGTDIVQMARTRGLGSYVVHAPVVHNDKPLKDLAFTYRTSYRYMQRKWKMELPINTVIVPLTRWGLPLYKRIGKHFLRRCLGKTPTETQDGALSGQVLAETTGYE